VGEIVAGVDAAAPGSQLVLGRLMELLFVELLRRQVARVHAGATGWFAALNDPVVAQALHLMHTQPAERWTVEAIARRVGSSRSVLGERFNALLGCPPIGYLAAWRIQLAAERLRGGNESVPRVAASVGYESDAAFSRAFKRLIGMAPGRWRETGGTLRPREGAAT
jgi:AraC-like DNA-binding protein